MSNLTATQIRKAFLILGKHIQLINIGNGTVTEYEGHMMATIAQAVSGVAGEYTDFSAVLAPLQGQIAGFISAAQQVPSLAQQTIDSYLQQSLALDMGLGTSETSVEVLTELATMMSAASPPQTVDPSGTSGFFDYFQINYSVQLPTASPSGTIGNGLISSNVMT